jgi:sulfatase maturation enzyme AslB (radical SAM superfamily)
MPNQDKFCPLIYNGLVVNTDGSLQPCCQYSPIKNKNIKFTNYDDYKTIVRNKIHEDIISGKQHYGCHKCYHDEQVGNKSLRQQSLIRYSNFISNINIEQPLWDIEIRLGNFCNLKCLMCFPKSSSSINAERQSYKKEFSDLGLDTGSGKFNYYWESDDFENFSNFLLKDIKKIRITGGEPFINPELDKILSKILNKNNDIELSFNTNLTLLPNNILEKLKYFKNLSISISLEGIENMNDYVRYPSKWFIIENNIQTLKQDVPLARIDIHHVLQHTSIYTLPKLYDFCKQNNFKLTYSTIDGIKRLTLSSAPPKDVDKFLQWAEKEFGLDDWNFILFKKTIEKYPFNENLYKEFMSYINLLDKIRNTDYIKTFNPSFVGV